MKVNTNIPIEFNVRNSYEFNDTRFLDVTIKLMHLGENFNGSYFDKEFVDKALPSLANTPILAYIVENEDGELDASDHRSILVVNGDSVKVKYIGQAIGVIPETNNARYVTETTEAGEELTYLYCDGLLWTKFDDPIEIMNRDGVKSQSMELHKNYTGQFKDDGLFHFEDFQFFGACVLGEGVQPAMKEASISIEDYSIDFENVKSKLEEFNLWKQTQEHEVVNNKEIFEEGGQNSMNEENVELVDTQEVNKIETENIEVDETENNKQETIVETDEADKEVANNTSDEDGNVDNSEEVDTEMSKSEVISFELSHDDIRSQIWDLLNPRDEEGYREWNYWLMKVYETYVMAQSEDNENEYYKFNYSVSDDTVSIDMESKTRMHLVWLTEEELGQLDGDKDEFLKEYARLKSFELDVKVKEKEAFEKLEKSKKEVIIEKFSKLLGEEIVKSVNADDMSSDDLETKLKVAWADTKLNEDNFSKNTKEALSTGVFSQSNTDEDPYGGLMEKHINK